MGHFPLYPIRVNTRDKPGMTKQIKVLFRRANRLHRKAIKTQLLVDIEKHRTARRLAKSSWKSAQFTYYHKLNQKLSDPKTSSKAWWKLNKNEMGLSKCSSIPSVIIGGNLLTDGIAKCEAFNEFFSAQCNLSVPVSELSTGHFSWTRPDPTRRNVDPTRPDPTRDCRQKV